MFFGLFFFSGPNRTACDSDMPSTSKVLQLGAAQRATGLSYEALTLLFMHDPCIACVV